jgi:hypothetical protein
MFFGVPILSEHLVFPRRINAKRAALLPCHLGFGTHGILIYGV